MESGSIDVEDVKKQLEMNERKKILENHNYKIWEGKDGYWHTYLADDNGKPKHKKRKNKEDIDNDIYQYYINKKMYPKFREVFDEWIAWKLECGDIQKNSYTRYCNSFERFFPPDEEFCDIRLTDVKDSDLEKFIKKTIKKHGLTKKTYGSFTLILNGVFKFAKKRGYTTFSISVFMKDFELSKKSFKKKVKNKKMEVFTRGEARALIDYFLDHPSLIHLGLAFMFYSGLRIGELATLKKEDNADRYFLNVCRTEVSYKDGDKYVNEVKELPKGDEPRTIDIPKKGQTILDQIILMSPNSEYLFSDDKGRIRESRFNYRLRKACREIGIPERASHKVRKTYGSNLLEKRVGEAVAQSQLGHKQISTTHNFYHYDILDDDERSEAIDSASSYN